MFRLISFILVSVISLAVGAAVKSDTNDLQEFITKAVEGVLDAERIKQEERYTAVLKEVGDFKLRTDRMEERIKYLEHENRDKDVTICSLQSQMDDITETIADYVLVNDKVQNFSRYRPQEVLNKCQNMKDEHFGNKRLEVRRRRQVAPTHAPPTPRIAFSAYLTRTNSHLQPRDAIKFDHVLYNDGNGYNPFTGAFIVPASGTYLFMFQFDSRVHTFVRLTVDGRNIVDAVVNPHVNTQDRENMSSNSAIIHVGIGQAVIVEVYDAVGEVASSDKYRLSTFSGFILYLE